jgi:hypothetical protein
MSSCTLGEGEIYQVTAKAAASVAVESFFGTTEIIAAENHVCRSAQPASQLFSLNMLALILEREPQVKPQSEVSFGTPFKAKYSLQITRRYSGESWFEKYSLIFDHECIDANA